MTNILVIGGAGYVGSHTCKALFLNGYTPVVYDSLSRGNIWSVKWGPIEIGDIRDTARLISVMRHYKIRSVVHFAAVAYVEESVTDPLLYYDNNVSGTISILNAMISESVTNLVFSSSCATYGAPTQIPILENTPQSPINPYGRSKLIVESILRDLSNHSSISSIALRYFNAAGADEDGDIGEHHIPETHVIPRILDATFSPGKPMIIYGDDYPTLDGTCIRDYIHVSDLAAAHVLALKSLEAVKGHFAYNLGTGSGISIKELIAAVEKISGITVPHSYVGRRVGDPPVLIANSELANRELRWFPVHSDLDNIIRTALNWYKISRKIH